MAPTLAVGGAVATTVMLSVALVGSEARVQVIVAPAALQLQLGPAAETNVKPAGSVSVTTAFTAVAGPPLRGCNWNVTLLPAMAGTAEATTLVMLASAPGVTVVSTVAVLLVVSGSAVPPEAGATLALLVTVPPAAVTRPTIVSAGSVLPAACVPACVQVTVPALCEQLQPLPPAETKVTDGGRLSVTTIAAEAFGPALPTLSV